MSRSKRVIIIGGGVIGGFTAYYLLENGWSVTVIDKEGFGQGASGGNCGLIVPNHILPINSLDTLMKGLLWMGKKDSPLYIKPRFNPGLIKWFCQFVCYTRPGHIRKSAMGRHALLKSSFHLYPTFMETENVACDWRMDGSMHVYRSKKAWHDYRKTDAFLTRFGIQAESLDSKAVRKFEPTLGDGICGGWLYRHTAHLRPEHLMSALRRILIRRGARIVDQCPVRSFRSRNSRAVSIITKDAEFSADAYILATGAWSPAFGKMLGCSLPIQAGKGYSITLDRPQTFPKIPCFFEEQKVVSTPWPDACRLGGTMEFTGFDTHLDRRRLAALSKGLDRYTQGCRISGIKAEWCGLRPMTADGLPFIDRSPRLQNVMIAAGHNMIGMSVAPATGKLVADMLDDTRPHIDPHPYRLGRHHPRTIR
jgi:D-amino-acid dehydrogenase